MTKEQLVEAITHLAFYSGWPTAMSAMMLEGSTKGKFFYIPIKIPYHPRAGSITSKYLPLTGIDFVCDNVDRLRRFPQNSGYFPVERREAIDSINYKDY